jgi:hypothetical protein
MAVLIKAEPESKIDAWIVVYGSSLLVGEKMSVPRRSCKVEFGVDFNTKAVRKLQKLLEIDKSNIVKIAVVIEHNAPTPSSISVQTPLSH